MNDAVFSSSVLLPDQTAWIQRVEKWRATLSAVLLVEETSLNGMLRLSGPDHDFFFFCVRFDGAVPRPSVHVQSGTGLCGAARSSTAPHRSSNAPHRSSNAPHRSSNAPHRSSNAPYRSSTAPHSLVVVGTSWNHVCLLCLSRRRQSWSTWRIADCSAVLQSRRADSATPMRFRWARSPQWPVRSLKIAGPHDNSCGLLRISA